MMVVDTAENNITNFMKESNSGFVTAEPQWELLNGFFHEVVRKNDVKLP